MKNENSSKSQKVLGIEYLMLNILSYLKAKDLSNVNQISKRFYYYSNKFNAYWLKSCNDYFCCPDEDSSEGLLKNYNSIVLACANERISWKNHFGIGIAINQNYDRLEVLNGDIGEDFKAELKEFKESFYLGFKEFYSLPELRKELLYVESLFNSQLQIHLFDFIYDQQDLYAFYGNQLSDKNMISLGDLKPASDGLPFEYIVTKINDTLKDFRFNPDREALNNIRNMKFDIHYQFYSSFQYNSENLNQKRSLSCFSHIANYNSGDYKDRSQPYNSKAYLKIEAFLSYDFEEEDLDKQHSHTPSQDINFDITLETIVSFQEGFAHNKLIYLTHSLILTVTHFCRTVRNLILIHKQQKDILFVNEYLKRYRAFIDYAIYLNGRLENINAAINICYELIFNQIQIPKFSILRMLLVIWNKEVLHNLQSNTGESLLIVKLIKVYDEELINEFNKSCKQMIIDDSDIDEHCPSFVLAQAISAVLDSTINEYSVFRLNHSAFQPKGLSSDMIRLMKESHRTFIKSFVEDHKLKSKGLVLRPSSQILSEFMRVIIRGLNIMPCIKKELALSVIKDLSKLAHQELLEKKKHASINIIEDYINGLHTVLDIKVLREYSEFAPELMETLNILKCWKSETLESDYQYIDELIIKEINRRNIPCNFSKDEEKSLSWSKRVY